MPELCIKPFITHVRNNIGGSDFIKKTSKDITAQLRMLQQKGITKLETAFGDLPHSVLVNTLSLVAIATYEYIRAHGGINLPSTEVIASPLLGASFSNSPGEVKGKNRDWVNMDGPIVPPEVIKHNKKWKGEVWKDPKNKR